MVFKAAGVAISNENLHLISVNDFSPVDPLEQLMTICEEVTPPPRTKWSMFVLKIPWRKQTVSPQEAESKNNRFGPAMRVGAPPPPLAWKRGVRSTPLFAPGSDQGSGSIALGHPGGNPGAI